MRQRYDLSQLRWQLAGYTPTAWTMGRTMELALNMPSEVAAVPARVPGSVQQALRDAGLLPDWNVGLQSLQCEWVENREWIFTTELPGAWLPAGRRAVLRCLGLDGFGCILLNGRRVAEFRNGFVPHEVDLGEGPHGASNRLEIVFTTPPRFLGSPHRSSELRDWKARFNYTWDWMPRNVQIGIWDGVYLDVAPAAVFSEVHARTDFDASAGTGSLHLRGDVEGAGGASVRIRLRDGAACVIDETVTLDAWGKGCDWPCLAIRPWWPNGMRGADAQALYTLECALLDAQGSVLDEDTRRIGFKRVAWRACQDAPPAADPWLCEVNGEAVFLAGVNWTPVRAHYADVTTAEVRCRIALYRDLGMNILRVWGGAVLERENFYDLCDELGMLVWQEFPLSSSGPDNHPPEDAPTVEQMAAIGLSYIRRRRHHVSLLMWCGGNELQRKRDGSAGIGVPLDLSHPMLKRLDELVARHDPGRRFTPTSSSGPIFVANPADFGKGIHWDVHGPWRLPDEDFAKAEAYWSQDDALFRSETGAPGAGPLDLIRYHFSDSAPLPVSLDNPLWRRCYWWIDEEPFTKEHGRKPATIEEYVAWSQARQARALVLAVGACRRRFPAVGGVILWMGHDSFPCPANTSIVDFLGRPKPVALALRDVLRPAPGT